MIQINDELLKHRNEIENGKKELKSTRIALTEVKVELESTIKELNQMHVQLESKSNVLKQVEEELKSTREQNNLLRKEMIEADNSSRAKVDQNKADVAGLRKDLNEIKKGMDHHDDEFSAFAASLTVPKSLGVGELVKFDKVWTNVKKDYDPITGVYTAPTSGVYQFSCTVMTSSGGQLRVFLWKNDAKTVAVYPGQIGYNTGTLNMVLELNKGDKIYIKQGESQENSIYSEPSSNFCLFSGYLIRIITSK
ncbi:multimerin-2-like [Mytilus trossulus]|uniref:multimerin-2-like n=1 Tax=Mytilus trossulus TaxID=6551 RepID=UPI003004C584